MTTIENIKETLVPLLSNGTWKQIESLHEELQIEWRGDLEPGWGRPRYVERVLAEIEDSEIVNLAHRCLSYFDSETIALENAIWWHESNGKSQISELTRQALADALDGRKMDPRELPTEFLERFVDLRFILGLIYEPPVEYGDEDQLLLKNSTGSTPYSHRQLLDRYGYMAWPDKRIFKFIEALVHPRLRQNEEQKEWVNFLNEILIKDGFALQITTEVSRQPIYTVQHSRGVEGTPKNLIFAADGPKPEIGFEDAINNDIVILKNAEFCLVYEEDIGNKGLLWTDLTRWWGQRTNTDPSCASTRKALGRRLIKSLQSPSEKYFFRGYFREFRSMLADSLPALIPQVYLHYDPVTIWQLRERGDERRFLIQRMDFLMLLQNRTRIIMEIDGKQHYSENNRPNPEKYAETVSSGRTLQLMGYEVYRFGGHELSEEKATDTVKQFFYALFRRHGVLPN